MDTVLSFIDENRTLPELINLPARLSALMLTPRFKASRHVIFMVMESGQTKPILVAKIPRMPHFDDNLTHEARVLETIKNMNLSGLNSIPRIIAYRKYHGYPILLETALNGQLMSPDVVRKNPEAMVKITRDWLLEVQSYPTRPHDDLWYQNMVNSTLSVLRDSFPLTQMECELLSRCEQYLEVLNGKSLPYVLEHGDMSHPNLLLTRPDSIGVLDWELANIHGLIASDYFFFLSYVAFSMSSANENGQYLGAFEKAFFDSTTWMKPHIRAFVMALNLPPNIFPSLFLLCWLRYLVQFIERLRVDKTERVSSDTAGMVRRNRYYDIWKYTVEHFQHLSIH